MKRVIGWCLRWLPMMLCITLTVSLFRVVSPAKWVSLSKQAAMLTVGGTLRQETASQQSPDSVPKADASLAPAVYAGELYDAVETVIPPKGDGGGAVSEQQLGGGQTVGNVTVKNSSGVTLDLAAMLTEPLNLEPADGPQVLIVHTHTTECYMSYYAGYYNADDTTRSTDNTANMAAVGAALAEELRAEGIGVIHDTTQHDHPQYTGAYTRSAETITRYLQEYPSIRVVLDLHRDAMMQEDQTKIKPTVTVDGKKAAQMMIVVGATDSEDAPNPYVRDNVRFALQLHSALETANSGLMRPLYMVNARYNQHLSAGSLLIEIGTDANVLSESLYSVRLLGRELATMLKVEQP